jgi:CubicO group peptidase (beta-lactamase class C family)
MGSVLVARDGKVLASQGYGYANLEWRIPNTPATKFRLGSITKQLTAAAILLLEERAKLEFQPGEKWNYSNSGYLLLGYLIEKISGQTYEQFVRENISLDWR